MARSRGGDSRDDTDRKDRYHHGDLREALIAATKELVVSRGAENFTLADACRLANVSPAAPYKHFRDKRQILEVLAERGYDDLRVAMETRVGAFDAGSLAALMEVGRTYVAFASDNPNIFRLMFGQNSDLKNAPLVYEACSRCFGHLIGQVTQYIVKERSNTDARLVAVNLWTFSEGDLSCDLEGPLPEAYQQMQSDFHRAIQGLSTAMKEVRSATAELDDAAREINTAVDEMADRTLQQAHSVEEAGSALRKIGTMTASSIEATNAAKERAIRAEQGVDAAQTVVTQMTTAIHDMNKASRDIGEIASVINELAFQTNLLALNAGVEAARAGDAGKGFAVVAAEVRALAQRSADAAKRIDIIVRQSNTTMAQGRALADSTRAALAEVVSDIKIIAGAIRGVADSAAQQNGYVQDIVQTMSRLETYTEANAGMSKETASAVGQLKSKSDGLTALVDQFTVDTRDTSVASDVSEAA